VRKITTATNQHPSYLCRERRDRRGLTTFLGIALVVSASACGRTIDNTVHVEGIRAQVESAPPWVERSALGKKLWNIERGFYESRGYRPAWVDGNRTTAHMKDLVQQFKYSELHGFDPAHYPITDFEQLHAQSQTRLGTRFDVNAVPELDAKLTYGYLRYAADLIGWSTSPKDISGNWLIDPKEEDLAARLSDAIETNQVRESLETLAPDHPQYKGLQVALAREKANPTGNRDRLLINLERWRWAPRDLGDRYILVNVPAYLLQVMEGSEPALSMRVIVGKPGTQTPLFSDEMTNVVFSPYWNIPENILRDETLPRVVSDPDFLRRNNMEVVGTSGTIDPEELDWSDASIMKGLRFRQRPGPGNALGLVKFIFPNHFDVYLHDTPGDRLFFREHRALSHGCVRVEDPLRLAQYVLADQPQWTTKKIAAAMQSGREQGVRLKTTLPVHIGYWTAWVQPDGAVTFTDDPYKFDQLQIQRFHQTREISTW
jgi:murein L,D-transpeptidase YcbB/YkuD